MRPALAFVSLLCTVPLVAALSFRTTGSIERAAINDNRAPAGSLRNGVLTIRLEAREVEWHPDGESAPGIVVRAFAEHGKRASVPGPLIRVPEGTEIHASVTNTLAHALAIRGLSQRGAANGGPSDTIVIGSGATRNVRFTAGAPGTYFYSGSDAPGRDSLSSASASAELSGAFVVDPRSAAPAKDRIFLIALWRRPGETGPLITRGAVLRFTINGRSWPNTERLSYALGDTVRFRVINASAAVHPMHLHGFYFDVGSRGDGAVDSVYPPNAPAYRVVTERTPIGHTFTMTWVPERAGNWLFHCHDNYHVLRNASLEGAPLPPEQMVHVTNHAMDMMGGLVMSVEVRGHDSSRNAAAGGVRRQLRLVAQRDSAGTDSEPSYGYVLQEGEKATSSASPILPGPAIVLRRGQPVTITVANHLAEPTAVHWHGMELESYFDGVADFSGSRGHIAHAIAPGDSFAAHFTPRRSGTFMYHPHADEVRQQQAGLTGVLLVVDDPATFDPTHDLTLLLTVPRRNADGAKILVNGSLAPAALEMHAGEHYRLRIVNVHTYRPSMITRLLRDSTLVAWRALAKDGMELPAVRATMRPAMQQLGNGETYDFDFVPAMPGDLRITVSAAAGPLLATVPVRVR